MFMQFTNPYSGGNAGIEFDKSDIISVAMTLLAVLFLWATIRALQFIEKKRSRPLLFQIDFSDPQNMVKIIGEYKGIRSDINIKITKKTSENGNNDIVYQIKKWAVHVKIRKKDFYILPSHPEDAKDLVVHSDELPRFYFIIGKFVGLGSDLNAYKYWIKYAFPSSIKIDDPKPMPDNIILFVPPYSNDINPREFSEMFDKMTDISSTIYRMQTVMAMQFGEIYRNVGNILSNQYASLTKLFISMWKKVQTEHETYIRNRVVPYDVYVKLAMIPANKMEQYGFQERINSGSINDIFRSMREMRNIIMEANRTANLVSMDKEVWESILDKIKINQRRMIEMAQNSSVRGKIPPSNDHERQMLEEVKRNKIDQSEDVI